MSRGRHLSVVFDYPPGASVLGQLDQFDPAVAALPIKGALVLYLREIFPGDVLVQVYVVKGKADLAAIKRSKSEKPVFFVESIFPPLIPVADVISPALLMVHIRIHGI